jgi:hypothetical protein
MKKENWEEIQRNNNLYDGCSIIHYCKNKKVSEYILSSATEYIMKVFPHLLSSFEYAVVRAFHPQFIIKFRLLTLAHHCSAGPVHYGNDGIVSNIPAKDFYYGMNNEFEFNGRSHATTLDKKFFSKESLSKVARRFTISITKNRRSFKFIPESDLQVFYQEIQQAYQNFQTEKRRNYASILSRYDKEIEKVITAAKGRTIENARYAQLSIKLSQFVYHEQEGYYLATVDALRCYKLDDIHLHLSYNALTRSFKKNDFKLIEDLLFEKWGNGVDLCIKVSDIFPEIQSSQIKIKYISFEFEGIMAEKARTISLPIRYRQGEFHLVHEKKCILSPTIKTQIQYNIQLMDASYAYVFYKSYCFIFDERCPEIERIKLPKSFTTYGISTIGEYVRKFNYDCQALEPVQEFFAYSNGISDERMDPRFQMYLSSNFKGWTWIADKVKAKYFSKVLCFIDGNSMHSRNQDTAVQCYIAVRDQNSFCSIYLFSLDFAKSTYKFSVSQKDVDLAIFFIWTYFGSGTVNKRWEFGNLKPYLYHFGIWKCYKMPSLELDANHEPIYKGE